MSSAICHYCSPQGHAFSGTGIITDLFQSSGLNECHYSWKSWCQTGVSSSANVFKRKTEILSGPAALLVCLDLKTRVTDCGSIQILCPCTLQLTSSKISLHSPWLSDSKHRLKKILELIGFCNFIIGKHRFSFCAHVCHAVDRVPQSLGVRPEKVLSCPFLMLQPSRSHPLPCPQIQRHFSSYLLFLLI